MHTPFRTAIAAAALMLVAGCSHESLSGTANSDLDTLSLDISASEAPGQASLPGFTMSADPTFQGNVATGDHCTWSAATSRLECTPVTRDGLTITRSIAFYDAAGTAQQQRDANTRSANTRVAVKGTTTTPKGPLTVDRSSSITVSGLGSGSTTHTINGSEQGTTSGSVTTDRGSVTISETFTSTTSNVTVPAPFSATSWPTAGTTARTSTQTASRGGETHTSSLGETVTYNGTSSVPVVLVRDGKSRQCTRDLATHRTTCG